LSSPGVVAADPLPANFDAGRELDLEPRTAAPDEARSCPWCGQPEPGRVCLNCGRRVARYTAQAAPAAVGAAAAADGDLVRCRNCQARVLAGARCAECGVPMAP
jgi:ribosomal protein L32